MLCIGKKNGEECFLELLPDKLKLYIDSNDYGPPFPVELSLKGLETYFCSHTKLCPQPAQPLLVQKPRWDRYAHPSGPVTLAVPSGHLKKVAGLALLKYCH